MRPPPPVPGPGQPKGRARGAAAGRPASFAPPGRRPPAASARRRPRPQARLRPPRAESGRACSAPAPRAALPGLRRRARPAPGGRDRGWRRRRRGRRDSASVVSISAISALLGTVAPSSARIAVRMPANGDGTSAFTLSVTTSTIGSYFSTRSPGFLSHRPIVPSATLSPSWGIVTFATESSSAGRVPRLMLVRVGRPAGSAAPGPVSVAHPASIGTRGRRRRF